MTKAKGRKYGVKRCQKQQTKKYTSRVHSRVLARVDFGRGAAREAHRHYVISHLLPDHPPTEKNKTNISKELKSIL